MIEHHATLDSTNRLALVRVGEGAGEGHWIRADHQTAGRGRQGRAWTGLDGNLFASTIVRLQPGDPPAPSLALVAGVALHAALEPLTQSDGQSHPLRLKWPNDLMLGAAKLAGILLERSGDAVVAGFGVNLAAAPPVAGRATAALADIAPAPDPATACALLADHLADTLLAWRRGGLAAIRPRWLAAAHPIGTALACHGADGARVEGVFAGLADDGALLLRRADGTTMTVGVGDVAVLDG